MTSAFALTLTNEEFKELLASHLDDHVFGMSVNRAAVDSYTITADGAVTVTGHFEE